MPCEQTFWLLDMLNEAAKGLAHIASMPDFVARRKQERPGSELRYSSHNGRHHWFLAVIHSYAISRTNTALQSYCTSRRDHVLSAPQASAILKLQARIRTTLVVDNFDDFYISAVTSQIRAPGQFLTL